MTSLKLIEQDDRWLLPVAGELVTRCCIDNAAVLLLCRNMMQFSIGEPFTLMTADGRKHTLDPAPGGDAVELAPVLRVMRRIIREGIAFKDGRLVLDFDNESRIEVPVGPDFESWTAAGPGGPEGLKIVSVPGGGLSVWLDRSADLRPWTIPGRTLERTHELLAAPG